jgi:hypothetical protein
MDNSTVRDSCRPTWRGGFERCARFLRLLLGMCLLVGLLATIEAVTLWWMGVRWRLPPWMERSA